MQKSAKPFNMITLTGIAFIISGIKLNQIMQTRIIKKRLVLVGDNEGLMKNRTNGNPLDFT